MRYRYEEYAPSNKRQYVIAVGLHELRALLGAAKVAKAHCVTETQEGKDRLTALSSTIRGLSEAMKVAESNGDNGKRRGPYAGENDI